MPRFIFVLLCLPVLADDAFFLDKVWPVMKEKCLPCHGDRPDEIKGEYDMRSHAGILKGGESEQAAIIPGNPEQSPFFIALMWTDEDLQMPPKENDRLSPDQVAVFRKWTVEGAPWTDPNVKREIAWGDTTEDGMVVQTSGGLDDSWTYRRYKLDDLWAYQPLRKSRERSIDAFVDARLAEGLKPAPRGKPRDLLRRLSYDLTGLPPTPMEMTDFLVATEADADAAWVAAVDRLLASPHYGEQMATRWLDVARYADSAGFANDFPRPNAWRYRDYVVRSFNADKPYDQFIREQVAGDEIAPDDPEHILATGFLRMGPWEHTAMSVAAVTRQQYLDDVVNSVGVTFLATALRCAKCHDHKFDPIPTRDYYRMKAVFAPVGFADRKLPYQDFENTTGLAAGKNRYARLSKAKAIRSISTLPPNERPVQKWDVDTEKKGHSKVTRKRSQQLDRQKRRFEPYAFGVFSGIGKAPSSHKAILPLPSEKERKNAKIPTTHILTGGSIETPAAPVKPGVLSVFSDTAQTAITDAVEGRRVALADWIVGDQNPLTARVIANRIWQWHFGQAIAGNPNNFGATGKKPTHPALLDWLATTLIAEGWSIKSLQRRILLSDTYRRAAAHPNPESLARLDPEGVSYAAFRPRRLTAEELRDSMLAISGELNRQLGGIPARPEINEEVAMQPRHVMGSVAPAYQPHPLPRQRNRRTLYAERIRTLGDPMLEVFNKPGPDLSCERRDSSTIAPQAFTLLNSPIVHARALAMARRIERDAPGKLAAQVARAFWLAKQRPPAWQNGSAVSNTLRQ